MKANYPLRPRHRRIWLESEKELKDLTGMRYLVIYLFLESEKELKAAVVDQ